ncbi:lipoprotein [Erwinia sp. CPCC 100877]|nr:lipoprotein [Erwinia sp. CPCC 100877]
MRSSVLTLIAPCALLLSACTTVTPAYKDIGSRSGPCMDGGPDSVAQQFYDYRLAHPGQTATDLAGLRPYLSDSLWQQLQAKSRNAQATHGDLFSSNANGIDSADVASASTVLNTDARNIPLRVNLTKGERQWQDEVLVVREGQCWAVDDIRYTSENSQAPTGTLRQALEDR